jgi:hypothetical protein
MKLLPRSRHEALVLLLRKINHQRRRKRRSRLNLMKEFQSTTEKKTNECQVLLSQSTSNPLHMSVPTPFTKPITEKNKNQKKNKTSLLFDLSQNISCIWKPLHSPKARHPISVQYNILNLFFLTT